MKTDDWVTMLATGASPVDSAAGPRRLATAIGWGAFGATLLMALLLGVRHDLGSVLGRPMFWVKLAFVVSLALASVYAVSRLSRPGTTLSGVAIALAAPVLVIWTLAALALPLANPGDRLDLWYGRTWTSCPWLIAMLSLPTFVAIFWAMRGFAPTRLRLAGAAAGLAAGAIGALVYSLHCPELAAPFLGTWYLLGVLIPATLGAVLGPRLLRW